MARTRNCADRCAPDTTGPNGKRPSELRMVALVRNDRPKAWGENGSEGSCKTKPQGAGRGRKEARKGGGAEGATRCTDGSKRRGDGRGAPHTVPKRWHGTGGVTRHAHGAHDDTCKSYAQTKRNETGQEGEERETEGDRCLRRASGAERSANSSTVIHSSEHRQLTHTSSAPSRATQATLAALLMDDGTQHPTGCTLCPEQTPRHAARHSPPKESTMRCEQPLQHHEVRQSQR